MVCWVVTRHDDTVKWIQTILGHNHIRQVDHLTPAVMGQMRPGDKVYGVLPLHLVKELLEMGIRYYAIVLPRIPAEKRGKELSISELKEVGIEIYRVSGLEMVKVR